MEKSLIDFHNDSTNNKGDGKKGACKTCVLAYNNIRLKQFRDDHREERRLSDRVRWQLMGKEEKNQRRGRDRQRIANLEDSYIRELIGLPANIVPIQLVEAQRELLKIKRLLKKMRAK